MRSKTPGKPEPNGYRFLFILLLGMLGTSTPTRAQSDLFKELKAEYSLNAELYFYASTLRMINIQRDSNFDEMVKDIRRLTLFQMEGGQPAKVRSLSRQFLEKESFEEMITMEDRAQQLYVMAREDEYIALMNTADGLMAVNLIGNIGVHKIPALLESFNSDNFLNVFEVGKSERVEHQQENGN